MHKSSIGSHASLLNLGKFVGLSCTYSELLQLARNNRLPCRLHNLVPFASDRIGIGATRQWHRLQSLRGLPVGFISKVEPTRPECPLVLGVRLPIELRDPPEDL